jgi:hypothetical protein
LLPLALPNINQSHPDAHSLNLYFLYILTQLSNLKLSCPFGANETVFRGVSTLQFLKFACQSREFLVDSADGRGGLRGFEEPVEGLGDAFDLFVVGVFLVLNRSFQLQPLLLEVFDGLLHIFGGFGVAFGIKQLIKDALKCVIIGEWP